jgi:endonuclease/exonuclease/phosphatase family metal-dependent hydrolase
MIAAVVVPDSAAGASPGGGTITVQTYNLNLGADLTPLFGVSSIPALRTAAAGVYADVVVSRPEERMRAVAAIIAGQRPDIVGLQEVALWSLAPYRSVNGIPVASGPYQPSYDFLASLLADLAQRGLNYTPVSVDTTFDSAVAIPIAIPISGTTAARYTDRNVVLVADRSHAQVANPQHANYVATFTVPLLGQTVAVHRGWASIDLTVHDRTFRFFDTHLEAYGLPPLKDQIRNPQAAELAALVDQSPYPVVVVGDINSVPTMCPAQSANNVAYGTLAGAGLTEVWPLVHPDAPCAPASWTSGQRSIYGPVSTLDHRIDVVFLSGGFRALRTDVVGDTPAELSQPNGLWPSDHASSVATLQLRS